MSIQAGLVGLPNVGKSSLFNALTKSSVPAENYPFCTIDPHVAITPVPDERLQPLKALYHSEAIIPSQVTFVDIAGLVKGAAAGQGLGNQFLGHIKDVNLIIHVLRCFKEGNIIHTSGVIDPIADYETIMAELILKDLESIEKRQEKIQRLIKVSLQKPTELKELQAEELILNEIKKLLDQGNYNQARLLTQTSTTKTISLLATKPALIIANLSESEFEGEHYKTNEHYKALVQHFGEKLVIPVSARLEYELAQLPEQEAQEMLNMLNITHRSLEKIIQATYQHLGLITFFTCGPREIHAWPIKRGITVRQAAGEIHSDLERGFICAEVFNYQDLITYQSPNGVKDAGKIRREGAEYIVQDGDIILVKFNV